MSTPFYLVDHRAPVRETLPYEERHFIRRTAPGALRLSLPSVEAPLIHYAPPVLPAPARENPDRAGGGWLARLFRGPRPAPA